MDPEYDVNFTGRIVDHYMIGGLIQAGGQGRVYRGRDQWLHRDVAIKVLRPRGDSPPLYPLIAEARTLSRINDPHVAGVYDFVKQDSRDFLVMEFVPGATLQEVLFAGPMPPAEIVRLGAQMARGLAAAHTAGIIHCDIKPANIKITSAGDLKILDFGVAALTRTDPHLDESTQDVSGPRISGTVPYMAPEQLRGEPVDERSDLFSAGVVLYEMATGKRAFPQKDLARLVEAIQHENPPRPSTLNPLISAAVDLVILKAIEKDQRMRYAGAATLAAALEHLAEHAPQPSDCLA
jgi:serine/threonine protein kinase